MEGLDPTTWRLITSEEEHENPHASIGDKISGFIYRIGMDVPCPRPGECDPTKFLPSPLILSIDKSHYDLHSHLNWGRPRSIQC